MARGPRKKYPDATYHIVCHSISEIDMFKCDRDKEYYMGLLQRYRKKDHCIIYSYILMDSHVHILLYSNGYDISKFMQELNTAYAGYFNRKYGRSGPLFKDRFYSSIIKDDTNLLDVVAYINNNAKDLPGYAGREETYLYSSYGIYTGYRRNEHGIVDAGFILKMFSGNMGIARRKLREFTEAMRGKAMAGKTAGEIVREYTENEYRDEKRLLVRDEKPGGMIRKISDILADRVAEKLAGKHMRKASGTRAFVTYIMRVLCGYTYKRICEYIGNMSLSGVSRLAGKGFSLVCSDIRYRNAFNALIQTGQAK